MKTYTTPLFGLLLTAIVPCACAQVPPAPRKMRPATPATQPNIEPADAEASHGAVVEISGENSNAIKLERARRIYDKIIEKAAPINIGLERDAVEMMNRLKKVTPVTPLAPPTPAKASDLQAAPLKANVPATGPATASTPTVPIPASVVLRPDGPATKPAIVPVFVSSRVPLDTQDLDRLALELRKEAVSIDELILSSSRGVVWVNPELEKRLNRLARDLSGDTRTAAR